MTWNKTILKTTMITSISMTIILGGIFLLSEQIKFAEAGTIGLPPGPPSSICPEDGTVQHWDKIIFQITKDKSKQLPEEYLKTTLDLKIIDPPGKVVNLEKEILDHLTKQLELREIEISDLEIEILDVRYETVTCGLMGPQGPQGPKGETGNQGPPGEQKLQVTVRSKSVETEPSQVTHLSVKCENDEVLTGGGYVGANSRVVTSSGSNNEWSIRVNPNPTSFTVVVNAYCAKLVP